MSIYTNQSEKDAARINPAPKKEIKKVKVQLLDDVKLRKVSGTISNNSSQNPFGITQAVMPSLRYSDYMGKKGDVFEVRVDEINNKYIILSSNMNGYGIGSINGAIPFSKAKVIGGEAPQGTLSNNNAINKAKSILTPKNIAIGLVGAGVIYLGLKHFKVIK